MKRIMLQLFVIIIFFGSTMLSISGELQLKVKETSLCKVPESNMESTICVSKDLQRVAYSIVNQGKWHVEVNGIAGKEYDRIYPVAFITDKKELVCVAIKDSTKTVIKDGIEGKSYSSDGSLRDASGPFISPNGKHIAYGTGGMDLAKMVVDGVEGPEFNGVMSGLIFSADSIRFGYYGIYKGKWRIVIDGVLQEQNYDSVTSLTFSSDGKHYAFAAIRDKTKIIVVDGVEKECPIYARRIEFSPDSSRIGVIGENQVVIDGKPENSYPSVIVAPTLFSPDSKHYSYRASNGEKKLNVLDGIETEGYKGMPRGETAFSPDGNHTAFLVWPLSGNCIVVLDGKEYPVMLGEKKPSDELLSSKPIFSPNSKRLAYTVQFRNATTVVVDGAVGKRYRSIEPGSLMFSPDGKHIVYCARTDKDDTLMLVVDDKEIGPFERFVPNTGLVFDGPTRLRALVIRNGEIVRMDIDMVGK